MQQTKNRVPENTAKSKIPDTARPFALVSGAREAYLNFLRNLTPAILLMAILIIASVKLSRKVEFIGAIVVFALVIAMLLSIWNNSMQLWDKIKEAYAVKEIRDLPFKGFFEFAVAGLLIQIAFAVIIVMGARAADPILEKEKAAQRVAAKQDCLLVPTTTKSNQVP